MSYMLYDSNKPFVPLQKEIDYIENYITLEKIRYEDRLDVSLNVLTATENISIAPLLILPFVENSFKHGFGNDIGRVWVHIDILVSGGQLIIKVENSKGAPQINSAPVSGIGLVNLKKRLELIYKDRYDLQIIDGDTYLVILKLKLEG
jgi:two-component system LytT family sensor kinase